MIKDACTQHHAMPSPGHPVPRHLYLPCTAGAGSLDLASLGVLEDLGRRQGGVSGGSWQSLLWGWGLWGRVDTGKLLCTVAEGTPRSRGAGGIRRWSEAAARKGEKWSEVLGYQVSGWDRADLNSPLHPTRKLGLSGAVVPSLPHTQYHISGLQGLPSPSPHKISKVLSLCLATGISAPFQQTHLLCRPAIKDGGAAGQRPSASRRNSHLSPPRHGL